MTHAMHIPLPARYGACLAVLLLAACAGGRAPVTQAHEQMSPVNMVAAIRAAAAGDDAELAVNPLRAPGIDDLRTQAAAHEAGGDIDAAVRALELALAEGGDDPLLLQERAELAVLQQDFALAGTLAGRAHALGAQVGPLCRRHWATLEQLGLRAGDAAVVIQARERIQACRVAGPARY